MFSLIHGRWIQKINIHKDRHDHTQTQMWNMFVTVELLYGTQRRRERKRE
jgi:hypothetical protein